MKKLLSGIQPSGIIHLGNYFGSIYNWKNMLEDHQCFFFIVDLHALTVRQEPEVLTKNVLQLAKLYLACGVEHENSVIFIQSHIKEHAELAWILNCYTQMGELERMTQFKDKSQQYQDNINVGLFTYPILMASDILLYGTNIVPVGEDQTQHVELTRDIAKRFNNLYEEVLTIPKAYINKVSARLKALDNPEKKMSKSAGSEYNYISLLDTPAQVEKKIKKAVTDADGIVKFDPENKAGVSNLLTIYHLITGQDVEDIEKEFEGKGYGDFKIALIEKINKFLKPIQEKYNSLTDEEVMAVLEKGKVKAQEVAKENIDKVKKVLGIV